MRGLVVLYETLIVGTRWLIRSAGLQAEDEGVELGKGSVALMLGITAVVGIGHLLHPAPGDRDVTVGNVENDLVQHLVEGLIRVAIFIGYLALIARTPDIRRVFQYHGAEHMTIHALEHDDPLDPEHVRKYPTAHPRCGTEFLVVVILLSILTVQPGRPPVAAGHDREPDPADPGDRLGGLRAPAVRRPAPLQPGRPRDHVARHPGPEDHDQAARPTT